MYSESKLKEELAFVLESFKQYLSEVRTGRPNPAVFEKIKVEAYGSVLDIKSLASISVDANGGSVLITPFDKSTSAAIAKGILAADLGYNPNNEGDKVRITIAALTAETREKIVDQMNLNTEERYRKHVRQIRQEFMQKIDSSEMSEDQQESAKKQVQKHIDDIMQEINSLVKSKEQEVLNIK